MLFRLFSYITLGEDNLKIERLGEQKYLIFVNSSYLSNIECDKDKIIESVKKLLLKLRYRLSLQGFYKVKVHVGEDIGLFIDIYKIDDIEYSNSLDLRILIFYDDTFYFETVDYFVIENVDNVRYFNNKYYCLASDVLVDRVIEFGKFIYGDEVSKMLNGSILV